MRAKAATVSRVAETLQDLCIRTESRDAERKDDDALAGLGGVLHEVADALFSRSPFFRPILPQRLAADRLKATGLLKPPASEPHIRQPALVLGVIPWAVGEDEDALLR